MTDLSPVFDALGEVDATQREKRGILEALANRYSEGDVVNTPDGKGVVSGVWTSSWSDDGTVVEATDRSPTYTVALVDGGYGHYKASALEATSLPDTDVENPSEDLEAMLDVAAATYTAEWEALDWSHPPSWRRADTPARVIALQAWADMNGQFDCGGGCCMGDLKDAELCASLKDFILGTTSWRSWGPD